MAFRTNSLFLTDGYKIGHKAMLAPGTQYLYGTWIPRSTKHAPKGIKKILSAGQQLTWRWLHDEFQENFFNQPKDVATDFATDMSMYLGLDFNGKHFEDLHDLGYLPIRVKALPEGIETLPNIPHQTFVNTKAGYAWLTLYLETIVSSLSWKTTTSATLALHYRRQATEWVLKTDPTNAWLIDFLCHDFSARGLDPFSTLSSGLGHAMSFRGSDSILVIPGARYFYGEPENEVCINSVNASEHSVSTTKIFTVGEKEMLSDWMKVFPTGILSVVSDTFDLWKLVTEYLPALKDEIMNRDGKLVIRPDSGDPVDIICGSVVLSYDSLDQAKNEFKDELYESTVHGEAEYTINTTRIVNVNGTYYKLTEDTDWNRYDKQYYFIEDLTIESKEVESKPEYTGVIELLWDIFGGTVNAQGYKVLDPHIGAIYGDSITTERQVQIYKRLADKGFAATNIVLGVGSFTYQFNTRDTFGFAAKGAWFQTETESYNIYKDPATDDGTKKSLKGLCAVFQDDNGEYFVETECSAATESAGALHTIYEDGKFYNETTLTEIRGKIQKLINVKELV